MRNERYDFLYLPEIHHKNHKACEFLLYQIEDFLYKDEYKSLRVQTLESDEEIVLNEGEHILDYLKRTNNTECHDQIIISHVLHGLISDICYFLQIALFASLQKRLTVTLALTRKPFVYNLLIILRLYFEDDFLQKFNNNEGFDTTRLKKEEIIELLKYSEDILVSTPIKASDIYELVFNPDQKDSIVNMSNKALHPSTNRNKNIVTEKQNLNFIFSTPDNIESQWDYLYAKLPLLLLYMNEVIEAFIFNILKIDQAVYMERLTERANYLKSNNAS